MARSHTTYRMFDLAAWSRKPCWWVWTKTTDGNNSKAQSQSTGLRPQASGHTGGHAQMVGVSVGCPGFDNSPNGHCNFALSPACEKYAAYAYLHRPPVDFDSDSTGRNLHSAPLRLNHPHNAASNFLAGPSRWVTLNRPLRHPSTGGVQLAPRRCQPTVCLARL